VTYATQTWIDGPAGGTPINAARLTHIENGIKTATDLATSIIGPSGTILGTQASLTTPALQTGNYAASANQVIPCDATAGSFTVTLPAAAVMGTIITVKLINTVVTHTVTVQSSGGDSINSAGTTQAVLQLVGESFEFVATGSGLWYLYGGQKSLSSLDTRYMAASGSPNFVTQFVKVGPTPYSFTPVGSGSAYYIIDKTGSGNDASLLIRDTGVAIFEVGAAADDQFHIKAVTSSGTVFTDAIIVENATAYVYIPKQLGVGTIPVYPFHLASAAGSGARTVARFENTSGAGAGLEFKGDAGSGTPDWFMGTDIGLTGANNFGISDLVAGYPPRLAIDTSGNVAIGSDAPGAKLDINGALTIRGDNSLSPFKLRGLKTTTGAPTTGTWALDDLVIDSSGASWLCTTAGTPGTWSAGGGGALWWFGTGAPVTVAGSKVGDVYMDTNTGNTYQLS
jgi:hypothetical protein